MDRDLIINLKLNRSHADQQSAAFHGAERAKIGETVATHERAEKAKAANTEKAVKQQIISLEQLAVSGLKVQKNLEAAADRRAAAEMKAAGKSSQQQIIGLEQLAASGLKVQDRLAKAAEKRAADEAKAAQKAFDAQFVSLGQLQQSGLKLHDRMTREAEKRSAAEAKMAGQLLSQEEITLLARGRVHKRVNDDKIAAAEKSMLREKGLLDDTEGAAAQLNAGLRTVAASYVGLQVGQNVLRGVFDVMRQSAEQATEFSKKILDARDALRELAAIQGIKPTNEAALETAVIGAESGLGMDKTRRLQESLSGRANLVVGRNISQAEFRKFQTQAAGLTAAYNIPADQAGELFGGVLKAENFQGKGQGSAEAIARSKQAFDILNAGSGKMAALAPQAQRLFAMVSENKLESAIPNASEAAAIISTMAEFNPEEAAVYSLRGIQGLRDFGDKDKAEFFKRSGITGKTSAIEAFQRANKVIGEEVAKGVPVDEALGRLGFKEQRENIALRTAFNARDTVFGKQVASARMAPDLGSAQQTISDFLGSDIGVRARGVGATEAEQLRQGAGLATFEAQKAASMAQLTRAGSLQGSNRFLFNIATAGGLLANPQEVMAESVAARNMGMNKDSMFQGPLADTIRYLMGTNAEAARKNDVNPQLIDRLDKLIDSLNKQQTKQVPPALRGAPPVMNRQ